MFTLNLSEKASKQFAEVAQWYEEKAVGLGDRFSDIIQRKLELIQRFPERYPKRKKNIKLPDNCTISSPQSPPDPYP